VQHRLAADQRRRAGLLHDVRQLVGQQGAAGAAVRRVLAAAKTRCEPTV
jgi:hypothetical protein